jgi:cytochrome P450
LFGVRSSIVTELRDGGDVFQLVPPEEWADPHPRYHRMRSETPIMAVPEWDLLVLTRYDDCERVLRDPLFSSSEVHRRQKPPRRDFDIRTEMESDSANVLLFLDPPDHTRLRRLVSKVFTPRSVERLRPRVTELVSSLLDTAQERGTFDVIADLGYPLPVTVICELLGVPAEDRDLFGPWSSDASRLLDNVQDDETYNRGIVAMMQLVNYLNGLFEERKASPRDDLVSHLIAVEEEGDRLTEEEMRAIVMLLFIAGHETTMNLIGNGTVALLRHREQWRRLVEDPSLAPGAVEEVLRYDGPVHLTGRTATRELHVGDVVVEKGQTVTTVLAAANRDPARFADPDRLDITRADNHHLAFSQGIHYCLGAALARLEGQEAFRGLVQRFPDLDLTHDPIHRDHFVLRGYREILVAP